MEANAFPQMKNPCQGIRPLPTRSQPRLQIEVLVLTHERVINRRAHPLRLRVCTLPQVEVIRRAFDDEL